MEDPSIEEPSEAVMLVAEEMLSRLSCPESLGDTALVEDWHVETHTIGCRNHADTPEERWWDEHMEIYEEYEQKGISVMLGDPCEGIFATITPSTGRLAARAALQDGPRP